MLDNSHQNRVAAEAALAAANTAKSQADATLTAANNAKTAADTAKSQADATLTAANNAKTAADTAKSQADASLSAANTAKSQADTAKAAADATLLLVTNRNSGQLTSDPTTRPDGSALQAGDKYFNTGTAKERIYNGTAWENIGGTGGASPLNPAGKLPIKNSRLTLPVRTLQRKVMATPFASTFKTTLTIASPRLWPSMQADTADPNTTNKFHAGSQYFTYTKAGGAAKQGTAAWDYLFVTFNNVNYGDHTSDNGYCVSFIHDGTALEIDVRGLGGAFICKVDDEFMSLTPTSIPANGAENYYYINFTTAKPRRIDFYGTTAPFAGVYTAATDQIFPAPVRGPRCIIIGDSFTEGTGATGSGLTDYVNEFASAMNWDDVWASGVGSTGYLAAPAPKVKYRSRIATDVIPFNPDIVMITGGYNDSGSTGAQIQTEAQALVDALKAGLPNATIVMVAPFASGGATTMSKVMWDQTTALKTVATNSGCVWISLTELPLQNGITPISTTISAAASAGATTLRSNTFLSANSTFKFPDGTRFLVKSITGTPPYTITTESGIQTAQASGAAITQVGGSLWQGSGRIGALSGWGSCDRYVSSDGAHPSQAGHQAIGQALATALMAALGPN